MKRNFIAKRFQSAGTGLTLDTAALAKYKDIVDLSIGDTDFTTDEAIISAAFRDAKAGHTHYGDPKGDPELISAVCKAWEEDFDQTLPRDHVLVSASSCLGMSLAMFAILDPGDEVIVFSPYFALYRAQIELAGGVCVDVPTYAEEDYAISEERLRAAITPRTKAIIPVHLFGQAADMDPIMEIAKKHNLIVIEDAAQAIGAEYKGQRAGAIGDYGCFSFFPSKNLGGFGDGGMVTANSAERIERLKIFRNHGMNPKYYHHFVGGNFRLDALQAAVLSIKLKHLDAWTGGRQKNAEEYRRIFAASGIGDKVVLPSEAPYTTRHIYNQFSILVKDGRRNAVKAALQAANIGCDIYYPVPLHMQECFAGLGCRKGDLPVSETVADEILALPIYPESTTAMREYVVETIGNALK